MAPLTSNVDEDVEPQIATLRGDMPNWIVATSELVERAENAERAATRINEEVADRSRKLIVEVAEWQQRVSEWQGQRLSPRLASEVRILKATLDAAMNEANAAASALHLL